MKAFIKSLVVKYIKYDFLWRIIRPISLFGIFIANNKTKYEGVISRKYLLKSNFKSWEVQSGPFKGMLYDKNSDIERILFPKLIGSYEKELWPIIEEIKVNSYEEIIDVGCAEGYYAIGLALTSKVQKIYAYDNDELARKACQKMAEINNVEDKVEVRKKLTSEELESFTFTGKTLIICDCEGCEKKLFNTNNIKNLKNCDLIIETHDFIDINISTHIKNIFEKSHTIESIKSIDDIQKALTYNFPSLNHLNLNDKKALLAEKRPGIMEWIICRSKLQ